MGPLDVDPPPEPVFRFRVFLWETLYNFLGVLALPLVLSRHGRVGAANRALLPHAGFEGRHDQFALPLLVTASHAAAMALWLGFDEVRAHVSVFELAVLNLVVVARAFTVGIKYAYYRPAEYGASLLCESGRGHATPCIRAAPCARSGD